MQPKINERFSSNPKLATVLSKVTLRRAIQVIIGFMMLFAAWEFNNFVNYIRSEEMGSVPNRPPMVEGFLPIAAIVAFKAMLATGEIDTIHPAGLMIFIATIVTAWIFRRALCSWICPLGTLSEYLAKLGKKLMDDNLKVPKWLDYLLLSIKFFLFFYIAKLFLFLPAQEAIAFMQIPYYAISDIKMFDFFFKIGSTGVLVILALVVLSMLIKNFWCRYLCPYGAMLGIIGLFSPFMLTKNLDSCINCSKCNKVCPNEVDIQGKKELIISTECTGCTSCVSACPKEDTLQFKILGLFPTKTVIFSVGFLVVFFGIIFWAKSAGHWETSVTLEQYRFIDRLMSGGMQ